MALWDPAVEIGELCEREGMLSVCFWYHFFFLSCSCWDGVDVQSHRRAPARKAWMITPENSSLQTELTLIGIKDVRWEPVRQGAVRLQEGAKRLGPERHGTFRFFGRAGGRWGAQIQQAEGRGVWRDVGLFRRSFVQRCGREHAGGRWWWLPAGLVFQPGQPGAKHGSLWQLH